MEKPYDSRNDTLLHIKRVQELLDEQREQLDIRAQSHDLSKLEEPEKSAFDIATPKLKGLTYGSKEYAESLSDLKVALDHHYAHNDHHPEHKQNGIYGMSFFSLLEMCADWKAAGERHTDSTLLKSFQKNRIRYKIDPNTFRFMVQTVIELGWLSHDEASQLLPEDYPITE